MHDIQIDVSKLEVTKSGTLYLDFDGVLNTAVSRSAIHCHFHLDIFESRPLTKGRIDFDQDCISALIKLQKARNLLNIVVASSWRRGCEACHFAELFNLYGIPYRDIEVLGTGDYADESLKGFGTRGILVEKHIADNAVEDYLCIDDTISHYNYFSDTKRVVFTNPTTGLTLAQVNDILSDI